MPPHKHGVIDTSKALRNSQLFALSQDKKQYFNDGRRTSLEVDFSDVQYGNDDGGDESEEIEYHGGNNPLGESAALRRSITSDAGGNVNAGFSPTHVQQMLNDQDDEEDDHEKRRSSNWDIRPRKNSAAQKLFAHHGDEDAVEDDMHSSFHENWKQHNQEMEAKTGRRKSASRQSFVSIDPSQQQPIQQNKENNSKNDENQGERAARRGSVKAGRRASMGRASTMGRASGMLNMFTDVATSSLDVAGGVAEGGVGMMGDVIGKVDINVDVSTIGATVGAGGSLLSSGVTSGLNVATDLSSSGFNMLGSSASAFASSTTQAMGLDLFGAALDPARRRSSITMGK